MEPTGDELAGIVDLFGALTREELAAGVAELAFKRGEEYDPATHEDAIADAVASYHLVVVDPDAVEANAGDEAASDLLVAGPVAFPELPEGATDLPHILDVEARSIDAAALAAAAEERYQSDVTAALEAGDGDRVDRLLDASYELEAWVDLDLSATRRRIVDARE